MRSSSTPRWKRRKVTVAVSSLVFPCFYLIRFTLFLTMSRRHYFTADEALEQLLDEEDEEISALLRRQQSQLMIATVMVLMLTKLCRALTVQVKRNVSERII